MTFTAENILLVGSVLIFSSILISKTGYVSESRPCFSFFCRYALRKRRTGDFNSTAPLMPSSSGMMALSIYSFLRRHGHPLPGHQARAPSGILLSTAGVLITTVLTGLFIYYITAWYQQERPTLPC